MAFPVELQFVDRNVYLAPISGVGCPRADQTIRVLKKESLVGVSDTKGSLSESCVRFIKSFTPLKCVVKKHKTGF